MAFIPEPLREAADRIHASGTPEKVMVRRLLWWFKAERRGYWIVRQIRSALGEVGLVTQPDFEIVYIDADVELQPKPPEVVAPGAEPEQPAIEETETSSRVVVGGSVADPVPRIGMLAAANRSPVSVSRDASLEEAVTIMLINDFSQLPVMRDERNAEGLISWKSIGAARALNRDPKYVRDCMETYVEIVSSDTSLFDAIESIARHEVVLVRNEERKIAGLVTTTDISLQFRSLAEPFLLLGEIENHIRRLVDGKFSQEELLAARNPTDSGREIRNVADLTFGEYIRLLETPANWERLGFALARPLFIERLGEIRRIRNEVMHFHPDALPPEDLALLRDTVKFMQALYSRAG